MEAIEKRSTAIARAAAPIAIRAAGSALNCANAPASARAAHGATSIPRPPDGEVGVAESQRGAGLRAFARRRRTKVRAVAAARDHRDARARAGGARERFGDRG